MSNLPVQVQWSLSATAAGTLTIARDLLLAAQSDNVQPIAILACQKFGNTLAISPETCDLIEKTVVPTPEYAPVRFLKAKVGWSKVDSTAQLAASQAGLRFLSLVAAITGNYNSLQAAQLLREMIQETAEDRTWMPTTEQLRHLLEVITPRCHLAGFTNRVLRWGTYFIDPSTGRLPFRQQPYTATGLSETGVRGLVDAFRAIARLGDASLSEVRIRAVYDNLPWMTVFTEWCVGTLPHIIGYDGKIVLNSPRSRVSITAVETIGHNEPLDITLCYVDKVQAPKQLVAEEQSIATASMIGMASLEHYGQYLTHQLAGRSMLSHAAFKEAVPMAVHQCFRLLRFSNRSVFDHVVVNPFDSWMNGRNRSLDSDMQALCLNPFPDRHGTSILHIMDMMFKFGDLPETLFTPPKQYILLCQCPQVKRHLEEIRSSCICRKCSERSQSFSECEEDSYYETLACIVADILCLGLFTHPEGLRVALNRWADDFETERISLKGAIESILRTAEPHESTFNALHIWSACLAGHSFPPSSTSNLLMSGAGGQVVWPTILDTKKIEKNGFLSLTWARGELIFNDDKYGIVYSEPGFAVGGTVKGDQGWGRPDIPKHTFPGKRSIWEVKVGIGELTTELVLNEYVHPTDATPRASPLQILENLASALILDQCGHESQAPISAEEQNFCFYAGIGVTVKVPRAQELPSAGVTGVHGDQDLQFFACAAGNARAPLIIRKRACLTCCLDVSRRTGYPMIIL